MTARNHLLFWSGLCAFLLGFVFLFRTVLLPFVLGFAIAYILNPVVNRLGRLGLGRGVAALLILSAFIIVVTAFFAALIPVLYKESADFLAEFPIYVEKIVTLLEPLSQYFQVFIGQGDGAELKELLTQHAGSGASFAGHILQRLAGGGQAAFGILSIFIFTPVVAYFMMKEWERIANWIDSLMPQDRRKTIQALLGQIDRKLAGFVRGQIGVAVILGVAYALALAFIGLKYGFLIGMAAGLISVIPMVGSAIGLIVSVAVAWFQSADPVFIGTVAAVFLIGQFIESNVLTPKLVGDNVGLHPLWIFFALLAGGSLFGILGMFLAVPVAAAAGVLIAFAVEEYKKSPYYKGSGKKLKKYNE